MTNKSWDISRKQTRLKDSSSSLSIFLRSILKKSLRLVLVFIILLVLTSSGLVLIVSKDQVTNSARASVSEIEYQSQKLLLREFDPKSVISDLQKIDSELLKIQKIITASGLSGSLYAEFGLIGREIGYPQNFIRITTNLRKLVAIFEALEDLQNQSSEELKNDLGDSLLIVRKIISDLDQIKNSSFLAGYDLGKYQNKLTKYENQITKILDFASFIPEILGYKGNKRYLLLFQNNREARPTGGFIGTFGIVEAREGRFTKPYIQDAYYLNFLKRTVFKEDIEEEKSEFPTELKPCPEIRLFNFHWSSLMDGNWIADFAKTAKKIEWSFDNVYHQGALDGVVAVDPNLVEELLEITGPIELPDHGVSLSAENFRDIVEFKVEIDNPFKREEDKTSSPKQILSDFADILYFKLLQLPPTEYQKVLLGLFSGLYEKHVLLYFNNPRLQKVAQELNFTGRILDTSQDYLHINRTNISATKSSRNIEDKINYKIRINSDYSLSANLKINRHHTGIKGLFDHYDASLLQIYVPKDSKLLASHLGINDIFEDTMRFSTLGKSVFANRVELSPEGKKEVSFEYELPFFLEPDYRGRTSYELLVQKQPGIDLENFVLEIEWPPTWSIKEAPGLILTSKNTGIIKKKLYTDTKFSFDFQT